MLRTRRAFFRRQMMWWGAVIVVYSIAAAIFAVSPEAALVCAATLSVAVVVSWAAGFVAAMAAPEWEEPLVQVVWTRRLWLLHASWLSIAFGAAVLTGVGLVEKAVGRDGRGVFQIAVLGFPIWGIGTILAYAFWLRYWTQDLEDLHVGARRVVITGVLVAAVVVLGAAGIGFMGGAVAHSGVQELLGFEGGLFD